MTDVTVKMTDEELVSMGQAMERKGFSCMEDYARWAIRQKTSETLKDK